MRAFPLSADANRISACHKARRKRPLGLPCRAGGSRAPRVAGGGRRARRQPGRAGECWFILDTHCGVSRQLLTWFLKLGSTNCHLFHELSWPYVTWRYSRLVSELPYMPPSLASPSPLFVYIFLFGWSNWINLIVASSSLLPLLLFWAVECF